MEHRTKIVGLALLCVAFSSAALTLGRARGAVLIGQPLELAVQVQLDAGEDLSSLCFDAEVFHADARQDASQVRVLVEAITPGQLANVRVLSSAPVDEPVVTVYLRTGCAQKTSRRYVVLADLASEVVAPPTVPVPRSVAAPAQAPIKPNLPPAAAVSAKSPATAPAAPPAAAASPAKAKRVATLKTVAGRGNDGKRPEMKVSIDSAKPAPADKKPKPARSGGQSRLKLDPVDLLSDRIANLDSFMTFAPTEDALLNIKKVQKLEADVKAMRDATLKSEASLVDLRARLQKAEASRFPEVAIYGLMALVIACLAGLAWLWNRQRRAAPGSLDWWSDSSTSAPEALLSGADSFSASAARREKANQTRESRDSGPGTWPGHAADAVALAEPFADRIELTDSAFGGLKRADSADVPMGNPSALAKAALPEHTSLVRSLNSDAILDIRHQAEFFVSLGKADQAATLLKKQISESEEPSPFVYLDLLNLLHSLGQKNEFQQYCQDFNLLFNGTVPEFAFFKDEGQDLESYPDVLSRITVVWPTPKVLELIETCIFRDPWAEQNQAFDLAALRDLLLLHAIAHSIVLAPILEEEEPSRVNSSAPRSAARTSRSSVADFDFADSVASSFPELSKSAMADLFAREGPPSAALDLDLSALEKESSSDHLAPTADVDLARLLPSVHGGEPDNGRVTDLPEPLQLAGWSRKKPAQEPLL